MASGISKEKEEKLLNMELHKEEGITDDKDRFGSNRIMRVVGGWIYWRTIYDKSINKNEDRKPCVFAGVFVPEP